MKPSDNNETHQSEILVGLTRQYKLIIAYNGIGFNGWQSQSDGSGIQDHLEKALATLLRVSVRVTSASRTDTGVHAEYQVVTFRSDIKLDSRKYLKGLNALLPAQVRVRDMVETSMSFHPNYSAKGKIYRYQIWRSNGEHPFFAPYVWKWTQPIDVASMRIASSSFLGEHDFTSFCATDSTAKSKVRTVHEIRIVEKGPLLEIWFVGGGFLKQMVRTMVGTLVAVGVGKLRADEVSNLLAAKDRRLVPATAPAEGLCLVRVCYDTPIQLDTLLERASNGYNLALDDFWSEY